MGHAGPYVLYIDFQAWVTAEFAAQGMLSVQIKVKTNWLFSKPLPGCSYWALVGGAGASPQPAQLAGRCSPVARGQTGTAHGQAQQLLQQNTPSTHIPVMLVARKSWITQQPQSHSPGEQGLQIKAQGWEGLALPTMCVGVLFPTEKGIQPLVPILRNPNNTAVTPGRLQEQPGKLARLTHYSRVVPRPPTTPQKSPKQMQALLFIIIKGEPFFCESYIIKINNDLVLLSIFTSNVSSFHARENI